MQVHTSKVPHNANNTTLCIVNANGGLYAPLAIASPTNNTSENFVINALCAPQKNHVDMIKLIMLTSKG